MFRIKKIVHIILPRICPSDGKLFGIQDLPTSKFGTTYSSELILD